MKVFADTNFLIRAFATRGLSADVLQVILSEHDLMTGEFVLTEFKRVLKVKMKVPEKFIQDAESLLRHYHIEAVPEVPSTYTIRDADDRWVLESAIRAKADVLITGDKDLLEITEQVKELNILTPRAFWERIQKS